MGRVIPPAPEVSDSRTFRRAFADLQDGLYSSELWLHLGWQDIKQRYRRSVLGPFWITIATGTTAVAMGGADPELHARADLVTTGVLDDGVHGALVRIGLV